MSDSAHRVVKRIIAILVLVFAVCFFGALMFLNGGKQEVRNPWGDIRLLYYTTNVNGTFAHFRFRSMFDWPVLNETAVEMKTPTGWSMVFSLPQYEPAGQANPGQGQTFAVKVPPSSAHWRVLVRSSKANFTKAEKCRINAREWLKEHHISFLADRIVVTDPAGYVMIGPEMEILRPGQLPLPRYARAAR